MAQHERSKLQDIVALFFACPIVMGAMGFVLGLFTPLLHGVRFHIHQAQEFLLVGFVAGLFLAAVWSVYILIVPRK